MATETQLACAACGTPVDRERDWALRKDGFDLVRCPECGLLMRSHLPAANELPTIYSLEYFRHGDQPVDGYADYLADADLHRRAARQRLALLDRFARSRGVLLDVGAAAGFFVDEAAAAGWEAEGVDVAEPVVRWGIETLGARLTVGTLQSVDRPGAFAAVTMWDYIEHSLDPAADLRSAHRLLHPSGLVAISTGDVRSLVARLTRSRWHLLTPRHHNYFFSVSTLSALLDRSGYDVVWTGHPAGRYSASHLAYKLDRVARLGITNALARSVASSRVGRIGVPVNLFDIAVMIARKRT